MSQVQEHVAVIRQALPSVPQRTLAKAIVTGNIIRTAGKSNVADPDKLYNTFEGTAAELFGQRYFSVYSAIRRFDKTKAPAVYRKSLNHNGQPALVKIVGGNVYWFYVGEGMGQDTARRLSSLPPDHFDSRNYPVITKAEAERIIGGGATSFQHPGYL